MRRSSLGCGRAQASRVKLEAEYLTSVASFHNFVLSFNIRSMALLTRSLVDLGYRWVVQVKRGARGVTNLSLALARKLRQTDDVACSVQTKSLPVANSAAALDCRNHLDRHAAAWTHDSDAAYNRLPGIITASGTQILLHEALRCMACGGHEGGLHDMIHGISDSGLLHKLSNHNSHKAAFDCCDYMSYCMRKQVRLLSDSDLYGRNAFQKATRRGN